MTNCKIHLKVETVINSSNSLITTPCLIRVSCKVKHIVWSCTASLQKLIKIIRNLNQSDDTSYFILDRNNHTMPVLSVLDIVKCKIKDKFKKLKCYPSEEERSTYIKDILNDIIKNSYNYFEPIGYGVKLNPTALKSNPTCSKKDLKGSLEPINIPSEFPKLAYRDYRNILKNLINNPNSELIFNIPNKEINFIIHHIPPSIKLYQKLVSLFSKNQSHSPYTIKSFIQSFPASFESYIGLGQTKASELYLEKPKKNYFNFSSENGENKKTGEKSASKEKNSEKLLKIYNEKFGTQLNGNFQILKLLIDINNIILHFLFGSESEASHKDRGEKESFSGQKIEEETQSINFKDSNVEIIKAKIQNLISNFQKSCLPIEKVDFFFISIFLFFPFININLKDRCFYKAQEEELDSLEEGVFDEGPGEGGRKNVENGSWESNGDSKNIKDLEGSGDLENLNKDHANDNFIKQLELCFHLNKESIYGIIPLLLKGHFTLKTFMGFFCFLVDSSNNSSFRKIVEVFVNGIFENQIFFEDIFGLCLKNKHMNVIKIMEIIFYCERNNSKLKYCFKQKENYLAIKQVLNENQGDSDFLGFSNIY